MSEPVERIEQVIELVVPPGYKEDARLDVYITRFVLNATRAKVQKGIKAGHVLVNGRAVTKVSHRVHPGDAIHCTVMRPPPLEIRPEPIPIDVVFEDEYLLVVEKPAGMVVHPAYGHRTGTMVHALLHHVGSGVISFEEDEVDEEEDGDDAPALRTIPTEEEMGLAARNAVPRRPEDPAIRPGIVHRLDKDTSGLMVVAKDSYSHAQLAKQFEARTIERAYHAIVWGQPDPEEGRIEAPLGRDPRDRKRMAVVPEAQGKHAATRFKVLEHFHYAALVECRLETGRTHQIRVHLRHIGHPVLGDHTYDGLKLRYGPDSGRRRAFYRNLFTVMPRQALHAHSLGFKHPHTGASLFFQSDPPDDMQHVLAQLRRVEGR